MLQNRRGINENRQGVEADNDYDFVEADGKRQKLLGNQRWESPDEGLDSCNF